MFLIFATTYVDSENKRKLTEHWLTLHRAINPDFDLLLVDSASPMLSHVQHRFTKHRPGERAPLMLHSFPDNIGHHARNGHDGWGRAFCYGLQAAIDGCYEYVAHIEGDSLFKLPIDGIVAQMRSDAIDVASVPVKGVKFDTADCVETGLMVFRTAYLKESAFIEKYDWPRRRGGPSPERVIFDILGDRLRMMPWLAVRDDNDRITPRNVVRLDWITHSRRPKVYDRFIEHALSSGGNSPILRAISSIKLAALSLWRKK